ncbi:hypothetical protein GVO57_09040 [Sphingomonas changnyeongensis]|uniref:Phage shock protein B n=1 Tax=Sphingomonas changnyeongensis TaxID=2698679 RepID=A0A7Z2NW60_9SPHN|nr:hypothetical protein [Sphingomonas changnyeongensis]QHL90936.1 hypothetical protein GVO57_09040 [Sphingomonas changnyeongensis]
MPGFVWFFVVVVGIPVVAGVLGDAFKRHLRFKERQLEAVTSETAEKAAQYAAQVERLEQRVRVLERIITDRGMDLATDIERLRDAPLN